MKKIVFGFVLFLAFVSVHAQEDPAKALKAASRALSSYNLDPANNLDKLLEAKQAIDQATASATMENNLDVWQKKGEIYNAICSNESNNIQLATLKQQEYKIKDREAPMAAFHAFQKALSLAEKKFEVKDALKGMNETITYLNLFANRILEATDYAGAYPLLDGVLTAREVLLKNGEKDPFTNETDFHNHQFVVAFCANAAGDTARAKTLFKMLYDMGYDKPSVYAIYFKILSAEGDPNAIKVLEKGREKFPDDSEILFAEINHYITLEQYDKLEIKLKEAIAKEPNNPSIYSALGNVYMNLHGQEYAANNHTKAEEYFQKSIEYYDQALKLEPKLFDALYSIGSVYFNRAVEILKEMNKLGLSKEEQKKYDELGKQVDKLFTDALPYFKKAENLDPNDTNTLIALKEILARQKDYDKSNEFKKRLEVLQSGGKNPKPFFTE